MTTPMPDESLDAPPSSAAPPTPPPISGPVDPAQQAAGDAVVQAIQSAPDESVALGIERAAVMATDNGLQPGDPEDQPEQGPAPTPPEAVGPGVGDVQA